MNNLSVVKLGHIKNTSSENSTDLQPAHGVCPDSISSVTIAVVMIIASLTIICIIVSCRKATRSFIRVHLHQGGTELERVFFTRRPLILDLAFLFFLAIWIFYAFREFRFIKESPPFLEGLAMFVVLDVGVFVHVCVQMQRGRPRRDNLWDRLQKRFTNTLSFCTYSLFVGFPVGSATKLLVILWQVHMVGSWVILLPYLLTVGITGIFIPSVAFYVILSRYQSPEPASRYWILKLCGLVFAMVLVWIWFYGFIALESFIPLDVENVCWTIRLLPILCIPVAAIIVTSIYPVYTGKGEIAMYLPEVLFFLCLVCVSLPILNWIHEGRANPRTVWYTMIPLFLCCIHQMMYFALCMANPLINGPLPPEAATSRVEIAPPRVNLTARRKELRSALRGTNIMNLGSNWIMRRRRVIQNLSVMPKPPNIDGEKCSICLEPFNLDPEDVNIGYLHRCGHIFHFDCVWLWIDEKSKCPLCREGVKITQDDMSLLSLSELRDLFHTRHRTTSDAKSLKSVKSSTTCRNVHFQLDNEPEPSPSAATSYDYEDMDREITRIFSVVLPETYPKNLMDAVGFPYVPDACTLCMESYDDNNIDVGYIMPCMHFFHVDCIAGWINQYNVCPHCPLGKRLLDDDDVYVMPLGDMLASLEEVKPWELN